MNHLISEKALTKAQTSQRILDYKTPVVETSQRDTRRWDDPVYWKGVRIRQCQSCKRQQKDVTRNGLCWFCDVASPVSQSPVSNTVKTSTQN